MPLNKRMIEELQSLERLVTHCLRKDQHRFRRTLERLRAEQKAGREPSGLAELKARVDESAAQRAARLPASRR